MTTTAIKLVSAFARFTLADIKGGEAAHAFRLSQVALAVEQALKGNFDPMREASTLTEGKAKKARAYHAGFAAIAKGVADGAFGAPTATGQLGRVSYIGALTNPENADARKTIATHAATALRLFDTAFVATMAEKAAPKAKAVAPVATPAPATTSTEQDDAPALVQAEEVEVDVLVDTVCTALTMGMLTPEQVEMIQLALATMPEHSVAIAA